MEEERGGTRDRKTREKRRREEKRRRRNRMRMEEDGGSPTGVHPTRESAKKENGGGKTRVPLLPYMGHSCVI